MTKIKLMSVREEDLPYIEAWAQQHQVEDDFSREQLTENYVESVKDCDGLSLSQTLSISEEIYKNLESYGIKQIAQRSAGFDDFDLDLAT